MGETNEFTNKIKLHLLEIGFVVIAAITCVASIIIFFASSQSPPPPTKQSKGETASQVPKKIESSAPKKLVVDISGAVISPDTYEVTQGARLKDVISMAGGLSEKADKDFFSRNFNLAQFVTDQEKVHIPSTNEISDGIFKENYRVIDFTKGISATVAAPNNNKIHINSDSLEKLGSLPGIGDITAQKILDGRPYKDINELIEKEILKKAAFDKVKSLVDL